MVIIVINGDIYLHTSRKLINCNINQYCLVALRIFWLIISVAWGVSQRISGFGKKPTPPPHMSKQLRHRQIIRSKLFSSSFNFFIKEYQIKITFIPCPVSCHDRGRWCTGNFLTFSDFFLVEQSPVFAALTSSSSITGAQAYWAVLRACFARRCNFSPQKARFCKPVE